MITEGDRKFIKEKLMPYFGVKKLNIGYSPSKAKWPDIWVELKKPPRIVVTQEWKGQAERERHKRLVHELCHIRGLEHGRYGKYIYSTYPSQDSYSRAMYRHILKVMG